MSDTTRAFGSFAVPDPVRAREFYEHTLGLAVSSVAGMEEHGLFHVGGVLVYPEPDHEPAGFTVLNLPVDDIDSTVDELVSRGVEMLRYGGFDQDDRGIARGEPTVAWFADPFGNVCSVIQEA
ncbi:MULTISPECIES: VOC family protein [unclassified Nocardiopsis]|uniref:VOC family protein n=1 Tax=unclassified Nocardiopsis TaxID=2649073 RepID=UPI00135B9901|nr:MULTISPECIES: VOC family protein [unclassified Nocardiopsis]